MLFLVAYGFEMFCMSFFSAPEVCVQEENKNMHAHTHTYHVHWESVCIPLGITCIKSGTLGSKKPIVLYRGYPPCGGTEVERMILYSLCVVQSQTWGPWKCICRVLLGMTLSYLGATDLYKFLGQDSFPKICWGPWTCSANGYWPKK